MTNKDKNKYQTLEVLKPNTQILTIKDVIAESTLSEEAKNKLNEMKEIEKTVDREKLYYRMNIQLIFRIFEEYTLLVETFITAQFL